MNNVSEISGTAVRGCPNIGCLYLFPAL